MVHRTEPGNSKIISIFYCHFPNILSALARVNINGLLMLTGLEKSKDHHSQSTRVEYTNQVITHRP